MKNLLFAIAVMTATLFFACSKENTPLVDTLLDDTEVSERGPSGSGRCMRGDTVDAAALPQAALDYLTATYPDLTIAVVVQRANGFGVELSDGTTIRFNLDGTHRHLCGAHPTPADSIGHGGHHPHDSTGVHPPHDTTGVHPPHDTTGVHPPHDTTGGHGGGHGHGHGG